MKIKNIYIFVFVFFYIGAVSATANQTYVNNNEINDLLKKLEAASSNQSEQDKVQKEVEEIQKKISLSNEKRTLESAEIMIGNNPENTNKRIKTMEKFFDKTVSIEEFIFSDNFNYSQICKNKDCITVASVDSEIFNMKIEKLKESISTDKSEMIKNLYNVYPLDERINLIKQVEQSTYSTMQNTNMLQNSYMSSSQIATDSTKKKTYIELKDGDVIGNIKISITPNFIKLSRK